MTESAVRTDQLSLCGVIVALQQGDDSGLATATGAHQCHCLTGLDLQAEGLEHLDLWTCWVVKLNLLQLDVPLRILPIIQSHSSQLA